MLALTSCSSTPTGEGTTGVAYQEGVPGGVVVETHKMTATVTGIDAANRKVTLVTPEGKKDTVTCGPEVINFDQIHVGDQIKVTVAEELAVYMSQAGVPPSDGAAAVVVLAPKGAKPGGVVANTVQVTAKVTAIDLKNHKATLQFPDGTTKTFAVRKDVDLTKRQVGEEVVIRVTEALAISVEKP
jgi:translation elongation factor P/translation initiation factor 5A